MPKFRGNLGNLRRGFRETISRGTFAIPLAIFASLFVGVFANNNFAGAVTYENLVQDDFTNNQTEPNTWFFGANANAEAASYPCLTAGDATTPVTSLPACIDGTADANGFGTLRLTNAATAEASYVWLNEPINLDRGLDVTFDMYQYGGFRHNPDGSVSVGADGLAFFLIDGRANPTEPGFLGGGLGYKPYAGGGGGSQCAKSADGLTYTGENAPATTPGLIGGWVGVGFDFFGNFSCPPAGSVVGDPVWGVGGTVANQPNLKRANVVSIASQIAADGLGGGETVTFAKMAQGLAVDTNSRSVARRTVNITINPQKVLSVSIDFHDGKGFVPAVTVNLSDVNDGAMPSSFKLGWSAGTGGAVNIHEINNLVVKQLAPQLSIVKTADKTAELKIGEGLTYSLVVTNDVAGADALEPITITDNLSSAFEIVALSEGCTNDNLRVTCVLAGLNAGNSRTFQIRVRAVKPGDVTNYASVFGGGDPSCAQENICTSSARNTIGNDILDGYSPTPKPDPEQPGEVPGAPDTGVFVSGSVFTVLAIGLAATLIFAKLTAKRLSRFGK